MTVSAEERARVRELLQARTAEIAARAPRPAPTPTPRLSTPTSPGRSDRPRGSTADVWGGPPGPRPGPCDDRLPGVCGHVGSMTREPDRCSCESCGASWKLNRNHRGQLEWVVVRRATS